MVGHRMIFRNMLNIISVTLAFGDKYSHLFHFGGESVFQCKISTSSDLPIIWRKQDKVLFVGNLRITSDKRFAVDGLRLIIHNLEFTDSGLYSCEAEESDGSLKVDSKVLRIRKPAVARIQQKESVMEVKEGSNLVLTCTGQGVPVPWVRWRKGGDILARSRGSSGLLLDYVGQEDEGELVCEAFNGVGEMAQDILKLLVFKAPSVELLAPSITFHPECRIEVQCLVTSSTNVSVIWMFNNFILQAGRGVSMWSNKGLHVLQIHSCGEEVVGRITCIAESSGGTKQSFLYLESDIVGYNLVERTQEAENCALINSPKMNFSFIFLFLIKYMV